MPGTVKPLFGAILAMSGLFVGAAEVPPTAGIEFFEKNVRPLLVERCYECHSAQSKKVKGKLWVDTKEGLLKGGETGPAVVPGNVEKSLLIQAVRYSHEDLQMPPKEPLTKAQIAAFEQWVKMGAPDPRVGGAAATTQEAPAYDFAKAKEFWSFKPVKMPAVPAVRNAAWCANDVDRFLLAKMEEKGLTPIGPAEKQTLIRRATYDLTGLPPTPQEVEAFVADASPNAFANVVERLLNSKAYGEKWGRHWLDVVRYADTSGCNSDYPVPDLYRYRNWVINAFNADQPYDQFLKEQLAGDLLPAADVEDRSRKVVATGYLANARRFGSRNNEFHLTIEDTIDNVGKGMLGLSISCARCHDHKFDPIPTMDYYGLYGIFASTRYAFPGTEIYHHAKDLVALGGPEDVKSLAAWSERLAELDDRYENLVRERDKLAAAEKHARELAGKPEPVEEDGKAPATKPVSGARTSADVKREMQAILAEQKKLEANPPKVEKAYAVSDAKVIADAKVQLKGEPRNFGAVAPRGFLTVLGAQKLPPDEKGSGRRELAEWIANPMNPLTARVMVNRIWLGHFGKGIVPTPNDFGIRGQRPAHPELLDYLAAKFVEGGWSVKSMHRLIMSSRAYQLAGTDDAKNSTIDFGNDYLWRANPRRLSAEEIRDSILALSGKLDQSMPGGHPFPPESEWKFSQHRPFVANYDSDHRSVYLMQQRIRKQPFLATFDGADTNAPTGVRPISTTAVQALWMMNDSFVYEQSDKFAARVAAMMPDDRGRIDATYRMALGRAAHSEEIEDALDYVRQCAAKLAEAGVVPEAQARCAYASFLRVIFSSNEFLFLE
ncbi:MAG: hypothetical protein JWN40_3700 [Phycisphaerales bacterium]|nr:hypothetical protein [Phycisphaerales bacterium]